MPPTPPAGVRVIPMVTRAAASEAEPPRAPPAPRPEAPRLQFSAPATSPGPICARCSTENPPENRFCVSCGERLGAEFAQRSAPPRLSTGAPPDTSEAFGTTLVSSKKTAPSPVASVPTGNALVTASPVLPVEAQAGPPPGALTICARCGGATESTMHFCKFCGSALAGTTLGATASSPNFEASGRPTQSPAERVTSAPSATAAARPLASAPTHHPPGAPPSSTTQFLTSGQLSPEVQVRLVAISRDGGEAASYPLTGDQIDLGREEGNIIVGDDPYISPRHLRLRRRDERWYLRDLGSINGVYLRLRHPYVLAHSDVLLLGLEVLRFEVLKDSELGLGPGMQHGTLLFGSPILPRYARLCQRTAEGATRDIYHLHRDETILGRELGDILFTDDPFMSRRHVSIRHDPKTGTFTATDLGSSNGTYVSIRNEVALNSGDHIRVGQHLFRADLGPPARSRPRDFEGPRTDRDPPAGPDALPASATSSFGPSSSFAPSYPPELARPDNERSDTSPSSYSFSASREKRTSLPNAGGAAGRPGRGA